jgi:NAD(P)-dependent dehydrogenase (short-subunit alcohol dehydrogenase family)
VSPNVALITGASQGIGAGLVAGYRRAGYAVVGVALSMPHSDEADYVAIEGDVAQADTARDAVDKSPAIDAEAEIAQARRESCSVLVRSEAS